MRGPSVRQKIAGTCVLALILHVVFASVGADYDLAVTYWLAYCLTCGMIINSDGRDRTLELLVMSIPSPVVVIVAIYYRALFRGVATCWLSGIQCALDLDFHVKAAFFLLVSIAAIWLFSYLSQWLMAAILAIFKLPEAKAKKIRGRIVWMGSVVLAVTGVIEILAHGWRR